MDKIEWLLKRVQSGDEEAEIALLAIFREEMQELSRTTENPRGTFDTLRSEFLLEIRSRHIGELLNRHKKDTNNTGK